jgi:hypothetical protein
VQVGGWVRELSFARNRPGQGTYFFKVRPLRAEIRVITQESNNYETRLSRASDAVESSLDIWEDNVRARNEIILEAMDQGGQTRSDVARWSRLSAARVTQIVAMVAAQ